MSYVPVRRGFTGPKGKMGSGDPHHIDLKLLESLPIAQKVKAIDALANQYGSLGREIEFSNAAVSGQRWDPRKDLSDKVDLLNRAAAAHAHSKHSGWNSLDFYVPFKGKSRLDKGAVEDASIFLPGIPGGKVRSGTGGGYGYYSESLDPSGQVVFRVGHGNIDRPESQSELSISSSDLPLDNTVSTQAPGERPSFEEASQRTEDILKAFLYGAQARGEKTKSLEDQLKEQLVGSVISQALNPSSFLTSYASTSPFMPAF